MPVALRSPAVVEDELKPARVSFPSTDIVVAGVSGPGKSTFGGALVRRLDRLVQEGDDLHPPSSIVKMAARIALDYADRQPWLDAVADWIARQSKSGQGGLISCPALKRRYRDQLRGAAPDAVAIVMLAPDVAILQARLAARARHFLPYALLALSWLHLRCRARTNAAWSSPTWERSKTPEQRSSTGYAESSLR